MPPYRLGRHWNTIQAYLIPGLEDDIGELSEELKKFMGICELLIDEKIIAKLRWIVCQWLPSRYLPPFSFFSSMFSPRHAAPCANWNISASKSTRSTRSTRPSKKVLQLLHQICFANTPPPINGNEFRLA